MNSKLYVAFLVALLVAVAFADPDPVPEEHADADHDAHAEPEGNAGNMLAATFGFVFSAIFAALF
jgi:hypothetical protein